MIQRYIKNAAIQLSSHFNQKEFDCQCHRKVCSYTLIDSDLIEGLEALRKLAGHSLHINSGFRCSFWNDKNGGKPGSSHLQGKAADIACSGEFKVLLLEHIIKVPLFNNGGVGEANTFLHVDVRGYKARWKY